MDDRVGWNGVYPDKPSTPQTECPEDCMCCSGEYCETHLNSQCDCDTAERHFSPEPSAPQAESVTCSATTEVVLDTDTVHCELPQGHDGDHSGSGNTGWETKWPAESVPAGKDAARWWAGLITDLFWEDVRTRHSREWNAKVDRVAEELGKFAASETAALRAERDREKVWVKMLREQAEALLKRAESAEREIKVLRETHCPGCECGAE